MAETLTKAALAQHMQDHVGLTRREGTDLVEELLAIMKERLEQGETVKISGFGKWVVRDKQARPGRNPRTNSQIIISRRRVILFRPSPMLRGSLNDES